MIKMKELDMKYLDPLDVGAKIVVKNVWKNSYEDVILKVLKVDGNIVTAKHLVTGDEVILTKELIDKVL